MGKANGVKVWTGSATGACYLFGAERRAGFVDKRDAISLLTPALSGGARPVFRVERDRAGSG
uniref:Uncharacterized protein n=1 Tax=viral metagenome TaxID=1070528 RepID=A0A6M3LSQ7_9ZZZZ